MDNTWDTNTLLRILELGPPAPPGWPTFSFNSVNLVPEECSAGSLFVPSSWELRILGYQSEAAAIHTAIKHGASAALSNLSSLPFTPAVTVLCLRPTLGVLVKMAQFARPHYPGKVVAITGSVGKTSTKDLVHHVLSHVGKSFKTAESKNTLAHICETTINCPADSQFAIVEVSTTRPGNIGNAAVARPHIGIITKVGISHLENYNHPDEILREKISLLDHLEGERIGIVHRSVLDADDARDRLIRSKRLGRLVTVGNEPGNDIFIAETKFDGIATEGTMSVFGARYPFRLSLPGRQFVDSAMHAMAVASVLGIDIEPLIASLATASPSERRLARHQIALHDGAIELLDDSYNAAPQSVIALLDTLQCRAPTRKVFVFGDMLGLANESVRSHEEIGPIIRQAGVDLLITVGNFSRLVNAGGRIVTAHYADADAASAAVPSLLRPGDLVAVKASKKIGLAKVVAAVRAMGKSQLASSWKIEDDLARSKDEQVRALESARPLR